MSEALQPSTENQPEVKTEQAEAIVEAPRRELTPRRKRFVEEYLIDLNGTRAAIRAGYSPRTANEQAVALLADVSVAEAVAKAKEQRATRVGMTADQVLNEMAILANACVDHYYVDELGRLRPTPDAPEGAMRAVQWVKRRTKIDKDDNMTIEVEFKLWDKPGSIKAMGKQIGLFPDKVEVSGPGGKPIEVVGKVERVLLDPVAEARKVMATVVEAAAVPEKVDG